MVKKMAPMNDICAHQPSKEERLAAKLRENLRRRKAQTRAQTPDAQNLTPPALSKPDLKS